MNFLSPIYEEKYPRYSIRGIPLYQNKVKILLDLLVIIRRCLTFHKTLAQKKLNCYELMDIYCVPYVTFSHHFTELQYGCKALWIPCTQA